MQISAIQRKRKVSLTATDVGPSKKMKAPKKTSAASPTATTRVEKPSVVANDREKKVVEHTSSEVGTLPKGLIWQTGLVADLKNGLLPPQRYFEPSELSPEEVKHLTNLEMATLQNASMIHAYISLNRKFSKLHHENADLKKEVMVGHEKVEEEKKKAEEERRNISPKWWSPTIKAFYSAWLFEVTNPKHNECSTEVPSEFSMMIPAPLLDLFDDPSAYRVHAPRLRR